MTLELDFKVILQYLPNLRHSAVCQKTLNVPKVIFSKISDYNPKPKSTRITAGQETKHDIKENKKHMSSFCGCNPFSKKTKKLLEEDDEDIEIMNEKNVEQDVDQNVEEIVPTSNEIDFCKQAQMSFQYVQQLLAQRREIAICSEKKDDHIATLRHRVCCSRTEDVPEVLFRYRSTTELDRRSKRRKRKQVGDAKKTCKCNSSYTKQQEKTKGKKMHGKNNKSNKSTDRLSKEAALRLTNRKSTENTKTKPTTCIQRCIKKKKKVLKKKNHEKEESSNINTENKESNEENENEKNEISEIKPKSNEPKPKSLYDIYQMCKSQGMPTKINQNISKPQTLNDTPCIVLADNSNVSKPDIYWRTKIPRPTVECISRSHLKHSDNNILSASKTAYNMQTMAEGPNRSSVCTNTDLVSNTDLVTRDFECNCNGSLSKNQNEICICTDLKHSKEYSEQDAQSKWMKQSQETFNSRLSQKKSNHLKCSRENSGLDIETKMKKSQETINYITGISSKTSNYSKYSRRNSGLHRRSKLNLKKSQETLKPSVSCKELVKWRNLNKSKKINHTTNSISEHSNKSNDSMDKNEKSSE